jgi:2-keto-3-deoxy-L-rhamnonate aldolase RhmA
MSAVAARTKLLSMIARGAQPIGIFVSSLDPASTDVLSEAGFDYVILDAEHGRMTRTDVENHVRAALLHGTVPFVRVLENTQTLIQSMLDVGAQGVFVPHVDTAEEARSAVAATRYSPVGKRGMCPACFAGSYTLKSWAEKARAANENVMAIPIIESSQAVDNIEEILAVDGIDVVHFGPGDLSADMGIDLTTHPELLFEKWQTVLGACRKAGKLVVAPAGFGYDEADMIMVEMELLILRRVAAEIVAAHRKAAPGASSCA